LTVRSLGSLPPWLITTLQIVVLTGILALLWQAIDWQDALILMTRANPFLLLAAALVLTLQTLLSAQRWRITAAQLGLSIPFAKAVREYYLAQVVNLSLPGGIIGDAGRAVRLRGAAGLLISGQAVVFERAAGQIGMLAVLLIGLALSAILPVGFDWPIWLKAPLTATLMLLAAAPFAIALALFISGPSDNPLRRFVRDFKRAVTARNVLPQQVCLSLGTAICNVAAFALCAAALGITLPVLVVATLVPLILFAMLMPFSIGGWGYREGAAVILFPLIGATPSEGLATSVAFGLIFLLAVLPGLILSWVRPKTRALIPR
jgi:uncharacterized membrane protein YbhN (UPF0104 family)